MIRIRTRVRIPFSQMLFAALLGVVGGIYIYKPSFDEMRLQKIQRLENAKETTDPGNTVLKSEGTT